MTTTSADSNPVKRRKLTAAREEFVNVPLALKQTRAELTKAFGEDGIAEQVANFQRSLQFFAVKEQFEGIAVRLGAESFEEERGIRRLCRLLQEMVCYLKWYGDDENDHSLRDSGWKVIMDLLQSEQEEDSTACRVSVFNNVLDELIRQVKLHRTHQIELYEMISLLTIPGDKRWNESLTKTILNEPQVITEDIENAPMRVVNGALSLLQLMQRVHAHEPSDSATLTQVMALQRVVLERHGFITRRINQIRSELHGILISQLATNEALERMTSGKKELRELSDEERRKYDKIVIKIAASRRRVRELDEESQLLVKGRVDEREAREVWRPPSIS